MTNKPELNSKVFQTGKVMLVSGAHLVHDIFSSFLAPLLPILIPKFGMTYTSAGFLTFIQRIPSLFNPLIGLVIDKLPIKYLLIFSPALTTISMSMIGVAPNLFWLIVILLMTGIGASMFHIPGPVVVKNISGYKIGRGMSFFMLGGEIARSLGPLLILSAVSWWGIENTYRLIPLGLGATIILFVKFKDFTLPHEMKRKPEDSGAIKAFKDALPSLSAISGIIFFNSMTKSAFTAFLPTLITEQGESLWIGGISLAVFQFAGAAGTFSAGNIADKIGRKKTLLISAISIPILVLVFIYSPLVIKAILLILLGFLLFFATPVTMAEINDINSGRPAFVNSIYMSLNFLISAINVLIVGLLSDFIGLNNTFLFCGIFSSGSLFFVIKLSSK